MDRRSFLKMFGAALLAPLLPKVRPVEEEIEEEDPFLDVYLPRNQSDDPFSSLVEADIYLAVDQGGQDYTRWMRYPQADEGFEILDSSQSYPTRPEITEEFVLTYLGDDEKRQAMSDFLMSLDCSDSIEVFYRTPCEGEKYLFNVEPLEIEDAADV